MNNEIILPCYCPVCKCSRYSVSGNFHTCLNCHNTFTKQHLLNANRENVITIVKKQVNSYLEKEVKKMNLRLKNK